MSKIIKIVGCILAAIGLGCIVKHIAMFHSGKLDSCGCFQDLKSKDWNTIKVWKGKCTQTKSGKAESKEESQNSKSALDALIDDYTNGDITREQFEERRKDLV
jgi:hypothetical protein